jgi:phosphohistidine swiveling domain-containing protein
VTRRTRLIDGRDPRPPVRADDRDRDARVVWLHDAAAADPALTGAKAATLAAASALRLPVLPGVVITTAGVVSLGEIHDELRVAWAELSDDGRVPLAVRSSSTNEDGATSSMAGMFTSVLGVAGWPALLDAVQVVLDSSDEHPMAVLLQPMLDPDLGGVLFGLDPVSGRTDRLLVESVPGGPASLVSGLRSGTRHVLSRRGRLLESDEGRGDRSLNGRRRRALAGIAAATERAFGGPQDIEWAFSPDGALWLLQSRPVTAGAEAPPSTGPLLGPGPVAETLPAALSPLEEDLWVEPMRSGIDAALRVVGATSTRALARSPIVLSVGGRVAADLDLLGANPKPRSLVSALDPRPPARRLSAAWRVGRLRRAMPLLAQDLIAELDADLAAVPALSELTDDRLVPLLRRARTALHSTHGHEVLAGMLGVEDPVSANAAALAALARGRADGLSDAAIVARDPVTLSLSAPSIGRDPYLPAWADEAAAPVGVDELGPREGLRLRARWLHELTARTAAELGRRLHRQGTLSSPGLVRWLRLSELDAALRGAALPPDLTQRAAATAAPPLPTAFRLAPDGSPVAVAQRGGKRLEGRGAGGGRGVGKVHDPSDGAPRPGAVLVVHTLEPGLAGLLPRAAGLVAETGSVLSHLAILARELGVPTVVGVADALDRFPVGSTVIVDGSTGEVTRLHEVGR